MTMILSRNLCALLGRVASAWENMTVNPGGLRVEQKYGNLALCVAFEGEGTMLAPIAVKPDVLTAWKGLASDVRLSVGGGSLTASAGKVSLTAPPSGEPLAPEAVEAETFHWITDVSALAEALKKCRSVAGKERWGTHDNILFDEGDALATDGHRVAVYPAGVVWEGGAVSSEVAALWGTMIACFKETSGAWWVETWQTPYKSRVALVFKAHGRTVKIESDLAKPQQKATVLRRYASPGDGQNVTIEAWAFTMARLFEWVAVYSNGAVLAWNDSVDKGLSGLIPEGETPLWTGKVKYFLALDPKNKKATRKGEPPPVVLSAGGKPGEKDEPTCRYTSLGRDDGTGLAMCAKHNPPDCEGEWYTIAGWFNKIGMAAE